MRTLVLNLPIVLSALLLIACEFREPIPLEITWSDLIPEKDRIALSSPPAYEDTLEGHPYFEALRSVETVDEMSGQLVKLAGFVVPLDFDGPQRVTEFLFVPFAGACLHTPPPPPNHIIYVSYASGLQIDDINQPYWIEGILNAAVSELPIAVSSYRMNAGKIYPYH